MYNIGKVTATLDFTENMSDVLEYSNLYDNGVTALVTKNVKYLNWAKG